MKPSASLLRPLLVLVCGLIPGVASGEEPRPHPVDVDRASEVHPAEETPPIEEAHPPPDEAHSEAEPRAEVEPRVSEGQLERRKVPMSNGMLRIPGGEFSMGFEGAAPGEPNERPVHMVRVSPFWLDRTEVTVAAMRGCLDRTDCTVKLGHGPNCTIGRGEDQLPVNCVPWQAADAYCRAVGKRLPTEAEWEFAAGGGQKVRFPWGSAPPSCTTSVTLINNRSGASCSPRGPRPVGSHPHGASLFGVEDLGGNVEEWVADWYADRYEVQLSRRIASTAPAGPAFGVAHVLRGGGWMSRPRETRITARNWGSPNEAGSNVGFRCAKD